MYKQINDRMVPLYPKSGINTVSPTVCNRPSIRRYSVDGGMITTIMKKNENFGRGPVKRMCNHIRNVKILRFVDIFSVYRFDIRNRFVETYIFGQMCSTMR